MKEDAVGRISSLPVLQRFSRFLRRHREGSLYLFFGGLTVLLSIVVFMALYGLFPDRELTVNALSWTAGVTFAFFTNRTWVFRAAASGRREALAQAASFYGARLGTLLLQELLLYCFVTRARMPGAPVKILTEGANVVINYLLSRFLIFHRR